MWDEDDLVDGQQAANVEVEIVSQGDLIVPSALDDDLARP
jgi:hypothetical protein